MHEEPERPRPEIFRFLDYRDYLRELLAHLAEKNRKYSHRWIAAKAGLKSPQLISMILKGDRKLSAENAQLLAMALGLSDKEEEYLLILVELESASHQAKQLELLDRIRCQFQNGLFKDLSGKSLEYISKAYLPVIRELCALKHFTMSASEVSRVLEISEAEAEEGLETLVDLGMLRRTGPSAYERTEPSLSAPDFVSPMLMLQYNLQTIERAFKATQLKRDLRYFNSLVVSLSSKDFAAVVDKIKLLTREVDMMGEGSPRRDDVFQLSIQFFSLTGGRAREVTQ